MVPRGGVQSSGDMFPLADRHSTDSFHVFLDELILVDMYLVDGNAARDTISFQHSITLGDELGQSVDVMATWDDRCMICAMSIQVFERICNNIGGWSQSRRRLHMADGAIVTPIRCWNGTLIVGAQKQRVAVEVFESDGGWELLLGKPAMTSFGMIHNYSVDIIWLRRLNGEEICLSNQHLGVPWLSNSLEAPQELADGSNKGLTCIYSIENAVAEDLLMDKGSEPIIDMFKDAKLDIKVYTGQINLFNPQRVEEVMTQITIGSDLTPEQRHRVDQLLCDHADCFALSMSEVLSIEGEIHKLNIPEGTTFPKKFHQRPLSPPQQQYLHFKVDEMLAAGVIALIDPSQVKAIAPTVLGQKAHEGGGLILEELQHRLKSGASVRTLVSLIRLPRFSQWRRVTSA